MATLPDQRDDLLAPYLDALRPGLAQIGFPAFVVDSRLYYRYVNAAYENYFGRAAADLVGRSVEDIHGKAPPDGRREALAQALAGESLTFDRQALHGPNAGRWARLHYMPIRAGDAVVGVSIVVVSIQHLKEAEQAIAARAHELQLLTQNVGVPMAYIGSDWRYRFVNTPGFDWLPGVTIANVIGKRVDEVYPAEVVAAVRGHLERALAGEVVAYEREGTTAEGERRWVRVTLIPDKADSGSVRGVYTIVIDIDADRRLREALERQGQELRFFTDNIPVSVAYLDTQRRYVFVNRAFAESRSKAREEIIGHTTGEVIGERAAEELAPLVQRVLAGETTTYEREIDLPSGEKRWFHVRSVPDFGPDGRIRGMYVVGHDVQELKDAQASLQEKEQDLRQVIDSIPTPMVYVDAEQRYRYVNDAFLDYVGDRRERIIGRKVREVLGPDRHDALQPVLERVLAGETVTVTRPIVYFDGRQRWMHIRYTPRLDAAGRVLGYYATTSDIHEQKTVEAELRRANSVLHAHFENTPLAVIERDPGLRVIRWSGSAGLMFGWNADEMVGQVLESRPFFFEEDAPAVDAMIRRLIAGPTSQATILNRNYRKDGSIAWVEWHNSALRGTDGAVVSILSLAQDVTSRIEAEERLQHMATHDGLTGLPNRVLLSDHLASALARALRSGQRVAVLFLDLDHFKAVNDTFGHRVGDELLRSVARRVRAVLRQSDILARLSGDEFVIVLEGFEDDGGPERVAQKVLDEVLRPFPIEGHEVRVSASLGYAIFPEDGKEPETLLKKADAAMYGAKDVGRGGLHAFRG